LSLTNVVEQICFLLADIRIYYTHLLNDEVNFTYKPLKSTVIDGFEKTHIEIDQSDRDQKILVMPMSSTFQIYIVHMK